MPARIPQTHFRQVEMLRTPYLLCVDLQPNISRSTPTSIEAQVSQALNSAALVERNLPDLMTASAAIVGRQCLSLKLTLVRLCRKFQPCHLAFLII